MSPDCIIETHPQRLSALRQLMARQGLDAYLLPLTDEYQGEYSAAYARRVTWLCGFDGSAGMAVIFHDKAYLLVDGRYILQAAQEVDAAHYTIVNSGETSLVNCLQKNKQATIIGYDPWLITSSQMHRWQSALGETRQWKASPQNLIDEIWLDQPLRPQQPIVIHPLSFAGKSCEEKLDDVSRWLNERGLDVLPMALPDSVCWLLNIRGNDIPYNPLPLVYGMAWADGHFDLFIEPERVSPSVMTELSSCVQCIDPNELPHYIATKTTGKHIAYDADRMPCRFEQQWAQCNALLTMLPDPCLLAKAIKNQTEIEGMRQAHRWDGAAVSTALCSIENSQEALTELMAADFLEQARKQCAQYMGPSFATIAGSGPNGAIVHYHAREDHVRTVQNNDVLLLDSGGQYPCGTTDITRTITFGLPSQEFKENFTLVLKGHIALASAQFPLGTSGGQLDALAREPLWRHGLDYDHGTGHGVGAYLCVHEGPQRISKRGGDVALMPGMITSNEPGYYKAGAYGIRIENLVLVVEKPSNDGRKFLGFETLTLCPIDTRLIVIEMLSAQEKAWLNHYHANVLHTLLPLVSTDVQAWLHTRTAPI